MNGFIQRHREQVIGMLNGFDRLRFRGTLRWLSYGAGLGRRLSALGVPLTQFKQYTQEVTAWVRRSIEGVARAAVGQKEPLGRLVEDLCRPVRWKQQRVRALNPLSGEDARLLETINRGEFSINGFRNRDLRGHLYGPACDRVQLRKQSAAVTRRLRLLRAHGLIRKVSRTHRYVLSSLTRAEPPSPRYWRPERQIRANSRRPPHENLREPRRS